MRVPPLEKEYFIPEHLKHQRLRQRQSLRVPSRNLAPIGWMLLAAVCVAGVVAWRVWAK